MSAAVAEANEAREAASPPAATTGGRTRDPMTDPHATAVVTVAWLIVANKPVYPLYVWWFVGNGTAAACLTMLATPAFLAIALMGARHPLAARLALPLVGALDTLFATKLFGAASGTELFFVPCLILAVASFRPDEGRWTKGLVAVLFVSFVVAHGRLGAAWGPWTIEETARLLEINVFAVASLAAFLGWRFSGLRG